MADEAFKAAQQQLMQCIFSYFKSVCLKATVDLSVPDALRRLGGSATASQLHSALSLPPARLRHFARLMRASATAGVFSDDGDGLYKLTPLSRLLLEGPEELYLSLSPFVRTMLHPRLVLPAWLSLAEWLKDGGSPSETPFDLLHGAPFWGITAQDAAFSAVFSAGMAADSHQLMDAVLRDHRHVFSGVKKLVDVGGGTGGALAGIAEAFPEMKCVVLDLPHVVKDAPATDRMEFVGGDMFVHVPPADAVLLKWILHDWSDDECKSILQRCKEAIPEEGKVVVLDLVVGAGGRSCNEVDHFFDLEMMQLTTGLERDEDEWRKLFVEAGFSSCKISTVQGSRSIIEVFP